jgi:predicted transcriptional regulator
MAYYAGKTVAFAIGILEAWHLDTAVQLSELRSERIIPPQGYRYLSVAETTSLMGGE